MTKPETAGAATAASANPATQAMLEELIPELSPIDVFRGVVPITFGDHRYELAAQSMEEDERWILSLDGSLKALLDGVRAGDDDPTALMAILMTATDKLLDAVIRYDRDGVLPEREQLKRQGRAIDALRAALTIWVATNPTLAAAVMAMRAAAPNGTATTSAARSSSSPTSTAGRRAKRGRG